MQTSDFIARNGTIIWKRSDYDHLLRQFGQATPPESTPITLSDAFELWRDYARALAYPQEVDAISFERLMEYHIGFYAVETDEAFVEQVWNQIQAMWLAQTDAHVEQFEVVPINHGLQRMMCMFHLPRAYVEWDFAYLSDSEVLLPIGDGYSLRKIDPS